jgi:hypothetical protein
MERARLRDLMESNIPKADSYLPISQFDVLFKSLNPKQREVWEVGGAVAAIIYRVEDSLVRIYRGNPNTWGLLEKRFALGELGIDAIASSPLGSGVLAAEAARDLAEEDARGLDVTEYGPPSIRSYSRRPCIDLQRGVRTETVAFDDSGEIVKPSKVARKPKKSPKRKPRKSK